MRVKDSQQKLSLIKYETDGHMFIILASLRYLRNSTTGKLKRIIRIKHFQTLKKDNIILIIDQIKVSRVTLGIWHWINHFVKINELFGNVFFMKFHSQYAQ